MDWKKLGKSLLFPPIWVLVLLTIASAVLLSMVFIKGWTEMPVAYGVYVLSFYTLCVDCTFFALVLPKQFDQLKQKLHANPLAHRYLTDRAFRGSVSLHLSLLISVLYAGLNLLLWYSSRSWWFVVLAVYYVILALMRYLLVRYVHFQEIGSSMVGEWKRSRLCACILLLVNLSLSGAVLMILYQNRGFDYPGIMIYVMALFTFYCTTHAIIDIIKYRALGSPIMSTAKIVALCAALVSMLNLETAMFAQFGADMSLEDQHLMIILTGAGVSITVVSLSVLLIIRSTKEIRREKYGK